MIKVGITGGIGVGKTTVCHVFETLGIPVYYADERAKWLMENNSTIKSGIIKEFGNNSYVNNKLNKSYLAKEVFNKSDNVKKINSIVHPIVGNDFEEWVSKQNSSFVLKETALMFESDSYKQLDKIICVTAPINLRIKRILKRDKHRTEKDVEKIISNQLPEEQKIKLSDFVIINDGNSLIIPQVLSVFKSIIAM